MLESSIEQICGYRSSVNAVLEVLEIEPAAPVAAFRLELGTKVATAPWLGGYTGQGSNAPRPLDSEFRDLVRDFELMLDEVLERFRDRYVDVFARLANGALEAARDVPVTDNSRVTRNLVQIALRLPADRVVDLADQITAAVPGRYGVLAPEPMGALVAHLAAGGIATRR